MTRFWICVGLFFPFSLIIVTSCVDKSYDSKYEVRVYNLEHGFANNNTYFLSDFAESSFKIIPSSQSLIGSINKVQKNDTLIFISDRNDIIHIFRTNGELYSIINRKGRGPGEYISIKDFSVNPQKNEVALLDGMGRSILFYNFDGEFVHQIGVNNYECQLAYLDSTTILTYTLRNAEALNNHFLLNILTTQGEELKSLLDVSNENIPKQSPVLNIKCLQSYNNNITYFDNITNTVYHIENQNLVPIARFVFGKYELPLKYKLPDKFPTHEENEEISNYFVPLRLIETDKYFFITGSHLRRDKILLVQKSTGDVISPEINWPFIEQGLINDLGTGAPFWPKGQFYNGELYLFMSIEKLERILSHSVHSSNGIIMDTLIQKISSPGNKSYNPWIITAKFK